ncbi:MAG: DegT/DnrJ/EryC1/StrS family aminotransferase [Spirochaetaceae bacterium]|jgi:dTDP-4-amino-4,6-dideoxygalactose transaminase|nr:DegT/DnrJ/EryC1/StrS family aminotransferase [Spirochaetaceae bacterium]
MNQNTDFIPFSRPSTGIEEEEAAVRVIRSGWLTSGIEVKEFEKEFASYVGSKHALTVNSATAGLHLSLEAMGIKKGDLVATTPYTFTATAEVIRYLGADPVFVDIEEGSWNIDPEKLENTVKRNPGKIKAVIPVHMGGLHCRMDEICGIAKKYNLKILEDAAHSFPVKTKKGFSGTIGDAGVYSFYANKTITTGEGGMVVTNNDEIAKRVSVMRLHGIDRDVWNRYTSSEGSWKYAVVEAGFKYNMTDIAAAIGREQLKKASLFNSQRKEIAEKYNESLKNWKFLEIPRRKEDNSWHLYIIRINKNKLTINRDQFIECLKEESIGTSVHYIPLHIMPYYKKLYSLEKEDFPEAYKKYQQSISIPIFPGMTENQVSTVVSAIGRIGKKYQRTDND